MYLQQGQFGKSRLPSRSQPLRQFSRRLFFFLYLSFAMIVNFSSNYFQVRSDGAAVLLMQEGHAVIDAALLMAPPPPNEGVLDLKMPSLVENLS